MTYPRHINSNRYVVYTCHSSGHPAIGQIRVVGVTDSVSGMIMPSKDISHSTIVTVKQAHYALICDFTALDTPFSLTTVTLDDTYDTLDEAMEPYEKALLQRFKRQKT